MKRFLFLLIAGFAINACTEDDNEEYPNNDNSYITTTYQFDSTLTVINDYLAGNTGNTNDENIGLYFIIQDLFPDNLEHTGVNGFLENLDNFSVQPTNGYLEDLWIQNYKVIESCNLIIESSNFLTEESYNIEYNSEELPYYMVQAFIYRAYSYLILTNLFGDVPLVDGDQKWTEAYRESKDQIYDYLISNLYEAIDLSDYEINQNTNYFYAANQLLARVFTNYQLYTEALNHYYEIIYSGKYTLPASNSAHGNSSELIWAIDISNQNENSLAKLSLPSSYSGIGECSFSQEFINSFEANDPRLTEFTIQDNGNYYQNKFQLTDNKLPLMRYTETLLMAAECEYRIGYYSAALSYINQIRESKGLVALESIDLETLLNERNKSLFLEGFRLTDLRRFGLLEEKLSEKGFIEGVHNYLPIPQYALDRNQNITQNPGY